MEALVGGVEFSDDVELGLGGLDVPVYISGGSEADSVEIDGTELDVFGAPEEEVFEIKTDTHRMLSIFPYESSADFSLSSTNISYAGYLSQWTMGTPNPINYVLGVQEEGEIYFIQRDGSDIEESPQLSDAQEEISFDATGDGTYTITGEGEGVTFTEDVILDLEGLDVTVYIAEGSRAGYLTVGETTLDVYGIPEGEFFKLKTDEHTVLSLEPAESSADFSITSDDIDSAGFISEWYADSDTTEFTAGTFHNDFYYTVSRNEEEIENSPFLSYESEDGGYEISFNASGVGTYNIHESHELGEAYLRGWAWSDNIGWVCFSSQDDPEAETTYGVNLEEDNELSGYAWSDNLGWISFNESDLVGCPEEPCIAKLESNELVGWGKVLSNDEWISLSGDIGENGDEYGVELIGSDFHGYAWGDETIGWLSFNCENENECEESDYKVWLSGLEVVTPTVRTNPASNIDPAGTAVLNGTLLDTGGHDETTVWFEWGTDSGLGESTPEEERKVLSEADSFSEQIEVELDESYYFRAVAENEEGLFHGNVLEFTVAEKEGQIIVEFGDFWKGIDISKEGLIEIVD